MPVFKEAHRSSKTSQARVAPKLLLSLAMAKGVGEKGMGLVQAAGFGEHPHQTWNETQRDDPLTNILVRCLEQLVVGEGLTEAGFQTSTHPEWFKCKGPTIASVVEDGRQLMALVKSREIVRKRALHGSVSLSLVSALLPVPPATEVDQLGQWC